MKAVVLGASGNTGRLVVAQLLKRNVSVRMVVRDGSYIPKEAQNNPRVEIVKENISEFDFDAYRKLIRDCDAVVSCLGHNITLRGLYGHPQMLVTGAIKNICRAIELEKNRKYKIILMNTAGNVRKTELGIVTPVEKIILVLLNIFLPPHHDNIAAARYVSETIGKTNPNISWVIVRPDSLVDENTVTPYEIHESLIRSPLFKAGKTSRINVGHFFAELLVNTSLWNTWKYKMPVIYNKE